VIANHGPIVLRWGIREQIAKVIFRLVKRYRTREDSSAGGKSPVAVFLGLAVLAVEKVAHRSPPCFVQGLAFVGGHVRLGYGVGVFGFAASWAAVGEAWFIRLQLKLF
jgi:hypothetical protein